VTGLPDSGIRGRERVPLSPSSACLGRSKGTRHRRKTKTDQSPHLRMGSVKWCRRRDPFETLVNRSMFKLSVPDPSRQGHQSSTYYVSGKLKAGSRVCIRSVDQSIKDKLQPSQPTDDQAAATLSPTCTALPDGRP